MGQSEMDVLKQHLSSIDFEKIRTLDEKINAEGTSLEEKLFLMNSFISLLQHLKQKNQLQLKQVTERDD